MRTKIYIVILKITELNSQKSCAKKSYAAFRFFGFIMILLSNFVPKILMIFLHMYGWLVILYEGTYNMYVA